MTFAVHNWLTGSRANLSRRCNTAVSLLVALVFLQFAMAALAADGQSATNTSSAFAETVLKGKQTEYFHNPTDNDIACKYARACFDFAEFATNDTQRAQLAQLGIKACRAVLRRAPNNMEAHYNLGLNLGQLARTKSLGALSIVDEMEVEFTAARALDEKFDYAGPDRTLGMLYLEAPSTISIGNRIKARTHLRRAAELAPEFPENRLSLAEALVTWRDRESARKELEALEAGLTKARAQFSGDAWAAAWVDWDFRLQKLRTQLKTPVRPAATSPKGAAK